jgi:hypothetical protein
VTDAERQDAFENAVARVMAECVRLAGECHPGCSYELRLVLAKLIARKAAVLIEMLEDKKSGGEA